MKYLSLITTVIFFVYLISPKFVFATIIFSISNVQKNENYFSVDALVSGIASQSSCFIQATLTSPTSPHYFGQTWSSKGEWFKYISTPEKSFIQENFVKLENEQPTKILFNSDPEDTDYKGPGEYLLKLKRYTGESTSSAGESNILTVTLSDNLTPITTGTQTPTTSPTSTPTLVISTPTPTKNLIVKTTTPTPTTPTLIITPNPISSPSLLVENFNSQVLSASDTASIVIPSVISTPTPFLPKSPKQNILSTKNLFFSGLFLAISSGSLLYFRQRKA